MNRELKPIEEPKKEEEKEIQIPEKNNETKITIKDLPSWNIEPPLEIYRGEK